MKKELFNDLTHSIKEGSMKLKKQDFTMVTEFENKVAEFFGAPYAIAVDSCTHGIELCLRLTRAKRISVPKRTYISVPMLANKLNIELEWFDGEWVKYYWLAPYIIDAATVWEKDFYHNIQFEDINAYTEEEILNTPLFINLSFQYQKHLSVGRGGMILTNHKPAADQLKKMSYDGRFPGIPWREQNIDTMGYHYYMTPETAQLGLSKFEGAVENIPRVWSYEDYPDLTHMDIFKNIKNDGSSFGEFKYF